MMRCLCLAACLAGLVAWTQPAAAGCRQALALGLDVSGSVDTREYRLQLDGLAAALTDPRVSRALLSMPAAPVRLAVYEWSGPGYQRLLLDWTEIADRATLTRIAAGLAATARRPAPPGTGLGAAMHHGARLLADQPDCWRRTLDISGDGRHNQGPHPRAVKAELLPQGITLNALVIGADTPRGDDRRQADFGALSSYFRAWVILGQGAFVETALGFEGYGEAMARKLLRELELPVLSALPAQ